MNAKKTTLNLGIWTGAWVVSLAIAIFGPIFIWSSTNSISLLIILINTGIGIGMIFANRRYLLGLDELQRKIHLESMGIALGAAVVGGISYSTLDITNVILYDAEISHLIMLIGIIYLGGIIIGQIRYR